MISSVFGRYLKKSLLDCSHIEYTHLSGGVDVPFEAIINFNYWRAISLASALLLYFYGAKYF